MHLWIWRRKQILWTRNFLFSAIAWGIKDLFVELIEKDLFIKCLKLLLIDSEFYLIDIFGNKFLFLSENKSLVIDLDHSNIF